MYKIALTVALIGIFALSFLLTRAVPFEAGLPDKTLVAFEGVVQNQGSSSGVLYLDMGNVTISCDCKPLNYKGKHVGVEGLLERFEGRTYIRAYRITILD